MRNHLIIICLAAISLQSCTEDFFSQTVEIDPPDYEKSLVLHQFSGNTDSVLEMSLTQNFGILETTKDEDWPVKNATIEWFVNGEKKLDFNETSSAFSTLYQADIQPGFFKPGDEHEIRVQHPDFQTLSAKQTVPKELQIDSVRFRQEAGISSNGDELSSIDVFLKDEPGVENYYLVTVLEYSPQLSYTYDPVTQTTKIDTLGYNYYPQWPDEPEDPNMEDGINASMVISDAFFDGQPYKFAYRFYRSGDRDAKYVQVRAITKDYYLYAVSAVRRADAEDFPLSDPVLVHGNLLNGIGIFGLFSEKKFLVE